MSAENPGAPFNPTDKDRAIVESLASAGVQQEYIAKAIINPETGKGITKKTLIKHFSEILESSEGKATAAVVAALFNNATKRNNVAAQIFWMKARGGWRESNRVEMTGADGQPLTPGQGVLVVPAPVTPEAWEKFVTEQQQKAANDAASRADQLDSDDD
jgi:hypothetical protein